MAIKIDEQLWSAAVMIAKRYGDGSPRHVAERIGQLAVAGDAQGVETWRLIASRLEQLKHRMTRP